MTELEFAAFLVSRVCHDLVGPVGAVVNGLEVLEEEHDASLRADALKIVANSADQALARLQFMRLAFGAAGSAGTMLNLSEVRSLICGLLGSARLRVEWNPAPLDWPKDWAKLIMNGAMIGADCLPRGGVLQIETPAEPGLHRFHILAQGTGARVAEETRRALSDGEVGDGYDARGIQPILARKLAKVLGVGLKLVPGKDEIEITAG